MRKVSGALSGCLAPVGRALKEMDMHWFSLEFSRENEKLFRNDYFINTIVIHRISIFASLVYFAFFAFLDHLVLQNEKQIVFVIRFYIVCPIILLIFFISFLNSYRRYWQFFGSFGTFVAGISIVVMTIISPEIGRNFYYVGIILVLIYCYMLLRIRFVWATATGCLIVMAYGMSLLLFPGLETRIAVTNVFFLTSTNILGMFCCYALEYYYRKDYFHRVQLRAAQRDVLMANEALEKKVAEKTRELQADLNLRKQTEKELVEAKNKAEESDRLKSAFLANMSHEIRTPMNGIIGFTEILKSDSLTKDRQVEYIEIIQKSGYRMLATINDLIDISKIEAGLVDVQLTDVDINSLAADLVAFFRPEAEDKGLKLRFEHTLPQDYRVATIDKEKLSSILTNLLKNAIKYTLTGEIELSLHPDTHVHPHRIEFRIRDTGIGVDGNKHERIFERFVQAEKDSDRIYEGSGLGLSITKSYVEMLGGEIRCESKPGLGSTFVCSLPFKRHGAMPDRPDAKVTHGPDECADRLQETVVLIAEDDPVSRLYLSTLLKRHCKEIVIAENGKMAVEIMKERQDIELVLMDIRMPEMDGTEATQKIREFNTTCVIIAQTAYAMKSDEERSLAAGFNAHIPKPVRKDVLMQCIEMTVRNLRQ